MDSLEDPFFSNLFHEGCNLDEQFTESQHLSQVGQVAQKESQFSAEAEPVAKKRYGSLSIEEDNILVSGWLSTILDANEQKHKTFRMIVWSTSTRTRPSIVDAMKIH